MKKVLALVLSLALITTLAITGTVAYLTDTAEDVNVMTLGNVKIEQHEQERGENGTLVDFTQAQPAYPAVGPIDWADKGVNVNGTEYKVFTDELKNVIDKIVTVENTGKSDAYVRTIIALEAPDYDPYDLIHVNVNANLEPTNWAPVDINGIQYVYSVFTYEEPLAAGEISEPSLVQLFLDFKATNEDCAKFGDTWEVIALSQAVQTAGFDSADEALKAGFGEVTKENVKEWLGKVEIPTTVATAAELTAALNAGKSVILSEDITVTETMTVPAGKATEINLAGHNISYAVENDKAAAIINNKGTLELSGTGTISFTAANPDMQEIPAYATNTITNTGTLTINDGVTVTNGSDGGASYAVDVQSGKFIMNGGTLSGKKCALRIARFNADTEFIMNGGTVTGATPAWIHLPGSDANIAPKISVTVNNGTFKTTKNASENNDVLYTYSFGNSHANTSITINGGEFLGGTVSIGSGYKGDIPTLTINGGTFEYDVLQWIDADNSKVIYSANK